MAKRKKSYEEIKSQRDRILERMGLLADSDAPSSTSQGYRFDYDRANNAINIASRYMNNIRKTKSFQRNADNFYGGDGKVNPETVRYASNTYMGLSNS